MSPSDFLKHCFRKYDMNEKIVHDKPVRKFALPYIHIPEERSMGQGRAFWCYKNDVPEIPVLLVAKLDKEIDSYLKSNKIKSKEYKCPN